MENRKRVVSLVVLCVSIVVLSVSLTYAYFVASVPDPVNETLSVTSGNLRLIFRDNSAEITPGINGTWNFGDSIEKEVAIENNGTQDLYAQILWENLVNTYLPESLTYTLEEKSSETGSTYKKVGTTSKNVPQSATVSTQELANGLLISAGKTNVYKITVTLEDLSNINQTADLNAEFITKFTLKQGRKPTIYETIVNNAKNTNPDFAVAAETDQTADGLYSLVDDSGTHSYYYRGAVTNNYVKFGTDKDGYDMYWRIIRFNGDGSVRMQYDGAGIANDPNYTYPRGFALTSQLWNSKYDDAKYVGWMFGGEQGVASTDKTQAQANETPSEIKIAVDTWYKENIFDTGYHDYIADEIFCNDRSIPGQSETGWSSDTGLGYAQNSTAYGATARTGVWNANTDTSKVKPGFICKQENDKFTVNTDSGGNGKLTYPVGLITADEIVAAGSGKFYAPNTSYYLYKGLWYWSLSPQNLSSNTAYLLAVATDGYLSYTYAGNIGAVAPVINLKPEYVNQLKGTGYASDPYRLN